MTSLFLTKGGLQKNKGKDNGGSLCHASWWSEKKEEQHRAFLLLIGGKGAKEGEGRKRSFASKKKREMERRPTVSVLEKKKGAPRPNRL